MTGIASLPMYDLPGLEGETDILWGCLRDALHEGGLQAPQGLDRAEPDAVHWRAPDLVLGHTCGLPLVKGMAGEATVLGAFDFGLEECPPGFYNSVIIGRGGDLGDDLIGASYAYNSRHSQSGYAALKTKFGARLGDGVETGSHLASLAHVAEGVADVAAIDAVTWRLAVRTGFGDNLWQRVDQIGRTDPTPGLPLITAPGRDPGPFQRALTKGIAAFAARPNILGIRGFVAFDLADYQAAIKVVD